MKQANKSLLPVVFLNSHPIQYFAPLYRYLQQELGIDLHVLYGSDDSIVGKKDEEFGIPVKWDIPLLEGYDYTFLKNYAWSPNVANRMWGQINLGVIPWLFRRKKSIIIVHGWIYVTNILAIIFAKLAGHVVCLRAETPLHHELKKTKTITFFKHLTLRFLFLFVDNFLYIGQQNYLFYKHMGVQDHQLFFAPYAVDNQRFEGCYHAIEKNEARTQLNLPFDQTIILFAAKLISKKNPFDLLKAVAQLKDQNFLVLFVGSGELGNDLKEFIQKNHLEDKVRLEGFVNQQTIPIYYRAADIFVMCSGIGETWGLSVNEAMNFKLPLILSDLTGSAYDLLVEHQNGYIYPTNDVDALAQVLKKMLMLSKEEWIQMGDTSFKRIQQYSFKQIGTSLMNLQRS